MPGSIKPSLPFSPSFLFDALIIGAGPAGLSTALTLCRQARPAAVFSTSHFRNDPAHRAHAVLSRDHQPPSAIREAGREQIEAYGTTHFVQRAVWSARRSEAKGVFELEDEEGEVWRGRKVVLAMGVKDNFPEIEGYAECWGNSIFQCMFCDGLERGHRPAAVLGFGGPESMRVLNFVRGVGCNEITVLTNGKGLGGGEEARQNGEILQAKGVRVDDRKIRRLVVLHGKKGLEVEFEDGDGLEVGFLQHTPPTTVVGGEVATGLGVEIISDGRGGTMLTRTEPFGETNVHGVFVAGDAGVPMKQITIAMTHGVCVGAGICMQLGAEADAELIAKLDDGKKGALT